VQQQQCLQQYQNSIRMLRPQRCCTHTVGAFPHPVQGTNVSFAYVDAMSKAAEQAWVTVLPAVVGHRTIGRSVCCAVVQANTQGSDIEKMRKAGIPLKMDADQVGPALLRPAVGS
jgi:hypothetical protein